MNQKISIRNIHPGEDKAVWRAAKTLGILERYTFYYYYFSASHKKDVLVAVDGEKIVGSVVPGVSTLAGEKIGSVDGIFVDRNAHGRGIGKALAEAVLVHFEKAGCRTYYVLVDRFNSPSWNMFLHKGFTVFEFKQQLGVYGWRIFLLWWLTGYFFEPGTFILRKTDKESQIAREAGEGWHFLFAWIGFSFVLWVAGIRFTLPQLHAIPLVLGVVGVSLFAHELSHKFVARYLGIKTLFKVWESGLTFSALGALLGVLLPFYGSTFIEQQDWPYNKQIQKMGLIYTIGPVVSLVLAVCGLGLSHWTNTDWLATMGTIGFRTNFILVLFNLIPIFPFTPLDGRKIFLWNKTVWVLLVIGFAMLVGAKMVL